MDSDALTAADVAAKLGINVASVYKRCKSGEWPATKIGRIYRFTPEQYEAITEPPAVPQKPRTQRKNIAHLLRSA
jgi:hypothetical protein